MTDSLTRPTREEDGLLRRLSFFERLGATLAPDLCVLKATIRERDARATVREPFERDVVRLP